MLYSECIFNLFRKIAPISHSVFCAETNKPEEI